jgi:hypothetical protein
VNPQDHTGAVTTRCHVTLILNGTGTRQWLLEVIGAPGWVYVVTMLPNVSFRAYIWTAIEIKQTLEKLVAELAELIVVVAASLSSCNHGWDCKGLIAGAAVRMLGALAIASA